ncbi:unnamed protein product, partial [Ascophyllum nodosum]
RRLHKAPADTAAMTSFFAHVTATILGAWLILSPPCVSFLQGPIRSSYFGLSQNLLRCGSYHSDRSRAGCGGASRTRRLPSRFMAATDGGERQVTGHDTLRPQEEAENTAAAAAAAIARRSEQLNLACNDVVRTVLDGDVISEKARASALRQRLEALRDDLVVPDDEMSELFFENLLLVCQH